MRINLRSWLPYQRLRAFEYALACRLRALELRTGAWRTALLVATAGMLLACLYTRPAVETGWYGKPMAELARNPFPVGVQNDHAYRVLTPLISYLVGLRGEGVVITNLLFAWLLLVILYRELRRSRVSIYYAALCTMILALSVPTLTTVYYNDNTDALAHLLLAVAYFQRRRPWILWSCFALSLFNREAALFMLPWLLYLRWRERGWGPGFVLETLAALAPSLVGYLLFRDWVSGRVAVTLNAEYYFGPLLRYPLELWRQTFGYHWLGWFTVFKLMWLVPGFAFVRAIRTRDTALRNSLLVLTGCAYAQMFLAWDTTRLLSMAFPAMIIAWEALLPRNRFDVKHWIVPCFIVSLAVPNLYTAHDIIEIMHGAIRAILT